MQKKVRREKARWKPALISLAAAVVIVAASFAPRLVLQAQDATLTGTLHTVRQQGGSLAYDEQFYYAGALIAFNRYGFVDSLLTEDQATVWALAEEYLADLAQAGVLPEEYMYYMPELAAFYGSEGNLYTARVEIEPYEYLCISWRMNVYERGYGYYETTILEMIVEEETQRPISLYLSMPFYNGLSDDRDMVESIVNAYIDWLQLADLRWVKEGESGSDSSYVHATCQEANLVLFLEAYSYTESGGGRSVLSLNASILDNW